MTFAFGKTSEARLATVHPDLQKAVRLAMMWQIYDFGIAWGYRNRESQNQAYISGASTKLWPYSKHNTMTAEGQPMSEAIDFYPWCLLPNGYEGIPWDDTHAFAVIGGIILAAGAELGVNLRYGGDWDMDGRTTDQNLSDWGHVEIINNGVR